MAAGKEKGLERVSAQPAATRADLVFCLPRLSEQEIIVASLQDELRDVREKKNAAGVRLSHHSPAQLFILLSGLSADCSVRCLTRRSRGS